MVYQWVLTLFRCLLTWFYTRIRRCTYRKLSMIEDQYYFHECRLYSTYVYGILLWNNDEFDRHAHVIYPPDLEIKDTIAIVSYLDIHFRVNKQHRESSMTCVMTPMTVTLPSKDIWASLWSCPKIFSICFANQSWYIFHNY